MQRKIVYCVLLGILFILLYLVGRPAKVSVDAGGEVRMDRGGLLAQTRAAEGLAEAQIGKVDPASSTIKLATFGMRGIAISLLWHQIQEQQKRHNWNTVIAMSNQLVFLEPHFITIWEYLGWNLAYNASMEFDDYRERYRWVIRGIDFLATGVEKNQRAPKLFKACGWTVSQKVGGDGSDENEQYRRLLREDEAFGLRHNCPMSYDRDNWMLGRRWYHQGEKLVLQKHISLLNESDFVYFANSRLNLFSYAKWKRKDGIFGQEAIQAWENAGKEWKEFAQMELASAIPDTPRGGRLIRLTRENVDRIGVKRVKMETSELVEREKKQLSDELEAMVPDFRKTLVLARWDELGKISGQQGTILNMLNDLETRPNLDASGTESEYRIIRQHLDKNVPDWKNKLQQDLEILYLSEQIPWLRIPAMFLTAEQSEAMKSSHDAVAQVRSRVVDLLSLPPKKFVEEIQDNDAVPHEKKRRAREILAEMDAGSEKERLPKMFRDIVGYDLHIRDLYTETTQQADDAHKLRYDARKAYYGGRTNDSITGWLAAMKKWDEVIDLPQCQGLVHRADFLRDHIDIVEKFAIILDKTNKIFSDVADAPVPMHRFMWEKIFGNALADAPKEYTAALDYAKKALDAAVKESDKEKQKTALEEAERYFTVLEERYAALNAQAEWMGHAPFYDLRDTMIDVHAQFVNVLATQNKPLPERIPLGQYVSLMFMHDKKLAQAREPMAAATTLLNEKKFAEAQQQLDKSVALWKELVTKYPFLQYDATVPERGEIVRTAALYVQALKGQNKPVSDDFPLKPFIK